MKIDGCGFPSLCFCPIKLKGRVQNNDWIFCKEFTCCKVEDDCFSSDVSNLTTKYSDVSNDGNQTIVDFDEVWMRRIREVQG